LGRMAAQALPRDSSYYGVRRRIERFVARSGEPIVNRYLGWISIFDVDLVKRLLRPGIVSQDPTEVIRGMAAQAKVAGDGSLLNQLLYLNFTTYLPDDLHVKVDRMSMANSLEARSPMLDTSLMEFVASLPPEFKVRGGRLKYILREAFSDLVPAEILNRRKHGFGVPLGRWFRGEQRGLAEELLLRPESRSRQFLEVGPVRQLLDEHRRGAGPHGDRLWSLVNLELWFRMLEDGSMYQPVADRVDDGIEVAAVAHRS
jgi:asparagine synthase (glutamine-hydrolysing)